MSLLFKSKSTKSGYFIDKNLKSLPRSMGIEDFLEYLRNSL